MSTAAETDIPIGLKHRHHGLCRSRRDVTSRQAVFHAVHARRVVTQDGQDFYAQPFLMSDPVGDGLQMFIDSIETALDPIEPAVDPIKSVRHPG